MIGERPGTTSSAVRAVALAFTSLSAVSSLVAAAGASAAFPGENGLIAYAGPGTGISVVEPDGSDPRQLTDGRDSGPGWSADGGKLVFGREVNGEVHVFTMHADGSGVSRIASTGWLNAPRVAAFSPSGNRIVFSRPGGIYTIRTDGTDRKRLVKGGTVGYPQYSPDGRRIVFSAVPPGYMCERCSSKNWLSRPGIWTVRKSGRDLTRLTNPTRGPGARSDYSPDFNPDGASIAFHRSSCGHQGPPVCTYVMRADGTQERPVGSNLSSAAWSPDGTSLVASVGESDNLRSCSNLYVLAPNGENRLRVTDNCNPAGPPGDARTPSWQPLP
jgi:Tol biopolymer transport system component